MILSMIWQNLNFKIEVKNKITSIIYYLKYLLIRINCKQSKLYEEKSIIITTNKCYSK